MKAAERYDADGVPWPDGLKRLSKNYRVTEGQLRSWFLGGCGIDGCVRTALVVDHDHDCCLRRPTCGNCTRGVLCYHHNASLESFIDSPAVVRYLQRTPAGRATTQRRVTVNNELFVPNTKKPTLDIREKEIRDRKHRNRVRKSNPSKRKVA